MLLYSVGYNVIAWLKVIYFNDALSCIVQVRQTAVPMATK